MIPGLRLGERMEEGEFERDTELTRGPPGVATTEVEREGAVFADGEAREVEA